MTKVKISVNSVNDPVIKIGNYLRVDNTIVLVAKTKDEDNQVYLIDVKTGEYLLNGQSVEDIVDQLLAIDIDFRVIGNIEIKEV